MKLRGKVRIDLAAFHILESKAAQRLVGREAPMTFNGEPIGVGKIVGVEHIDGEWWVFYEGESDEPWDKLIVGKYGR